MEGPDDLFERARAETDIEAVAGVKLYRAGRRMRGECPLCGASAGKKAGGAFSVDPKAGVFYCFACAKGGDVIDLEQELKGGSKRDAALRLVGEVVAPAADPRSRPAPRPRPAPAAPGDDDFHLRIALACWKGGSSAAGSPVPVYLRARGISGRPLFLALKQLRFHPAAYHSGSGRSEVRLPAMIGLVRTPAGPTGGVHVTYLSPDGRSKTHREPAKRMWGPQARDGAPGGVWLTHPEAEGPLLVGEGLESTLSGAVLEGRPCRAVAALSLRALQGGWLADKWGRRDPACPQPDPELAAFTWPEPEAAPWGEVLILVDRDMGPIEIKVRKPLGGTRKIKLDAEQRAQVCGALARAAWRRAGANAVRILAPGPGRDFNDELRAVLAAQEGRAA